MRFLIEIKGVDPAQAGVPMAIYEYHQYQAFKLKAVESIRHRKDSDAFRQAELRSAEKDGLVEVWRGGHRIAIASLGKLVLVQAAPRRPAPPLL